MKWGGGGGRQPLWVGWRERERKRKGGFWREMEVYFLTCYLWQKQHRERKGGIWQNAGKTGFSEQNPRQPGEGRSDCVITCAWSVACVPTSYTCIRQKLYVVYFLSSLKSRRCCWHVMCILFSLFACFFFLCHGLPFNAAKFRVCLSMSVSVAPNKVCVCVCTVSTDFHHSLCSNVASALRYRLLLQMSAGHIFRLKSPPNVWDNI